MSATDQSFFDKMNASYEERNRIKIVVEVILIVAGINWYMTSRFRSKEDTIPDLIAQPWSFGVFNNDDVVYAIQEMVYTIVGFVAVARLTMLLTKVKPPKWWSGNKGN